MPEKDYRYLPDKVLLENGRRLDVVVGIVCLCFKGAGHEGSLKRIAVMWSTQEWRRKLRKRMLVLTVQAV